MYLGVDTRGERRVVNELHRILRYDVIVNETLKWRRETINSCKREHSAIGNFEAPISPSPDEVSTSA